MEQTFELILKNMFVEEKAVKIIWRLLCCLHWKWFNSWLFCVLMLVVVRFSVIKILFHSTYIKFKANCIAFGHFRYKRYLRNNKNAVCTQNRKSAQYRGPMTLWFRKDEKLSLQIRIEVIVVQ
jgi:hypothetical protein